MIREFRRDDVPAVVSLHRELLPYELVTERGFLHWIDSEPERAHLRCWVEERGGELAGWAEASLRWATSANVGEIWIGVREAHRRQGIGSRLYELAEAHLREHGPRSVETWVSDDAGRAFVRRRGFVKTREDRAWELDPRSVDLSRLPALEAAKAAEGFSLVPVRSVADRTPELHALYAATAVDAPDDFPEDNIGYDEWIAETWKNPELDRDGSFVILDGDRPVSLAWLLVDRESGCAANELTGTLREYRRRGLGRLAKLATIRWARANGITRILTGNDGTNADMVALNEHLGYRHLLIEEKFVREL